MKTPNNTSCSVSNGCVEAQSTQRLPQMAYRQPANRRKESRRQPIIEIEDLEMSQLARLDAAIINMASYLVEKEAGWEI